jgi:N-acetylglutamate synthase/N-acetylornithine aminotransferase
MDAANSINYLSGGSVQKVSYIAIETVLDRASLTSDFCADYVQINAEYTT